MLLRICFIFREHSLESLSFRVTDYDTNLWIGIDFLDVLLLESYRRCDVTKTSM